MGNAEGTPKCVWRSVQEDLSDEEWDLIADLFPTYTGPGKIGRPLRYPRRRIVDAILYVVATGCQWRALPACYPPWKNVQHYHVAWSRDGTWERAVDRLRALVREQEGRQADPSAGVVDARSVRGTSTVGAATRGYDAGKRISGRKTFGLVDTTGLLLAVVIVTAATSDNVGGIAVAGAAKDKSPRLKKIFCDSGFKKAFKTYCAARHISAEVVRRIHPHQFQALPRRWVVERTWAWLMNNRRLQVDYERLPVVAAGFVWAAHARLLLRRLTTPDAP